MTVSTTASCASLYGASCASAHIENTYKIRWVANYNHYNEQSRMTMLQYIIVPPYRYMWEKAEGIAHQEKQGNRPL